MKRIFCISLAALMLVSVAACTRAKPEVPTPTLVSANSVVSPQAQPTETPAVDLTPVPVETTAAQPTLIPTPTVPPQFLATAGPPLANTPAASAPQSGALPNPGTYTVQRGEWIYSIARKFGITPQALVAANPGINPNLLYPGQVLRIPGGGGGNVPNPPIGGKTYTVRAGDTLFSIAVRNGTTVYALQAANNVGDPNFIYPGQVLRLP